MRLLTKDVERDDVDEEDVSAPGGDHVEVGQGAEGSPVDVARLHRLSFVEFKPKIDFLFLKRMKLNQILPYHTHIRTFDILHTNFVSCIFFYCRKAVLRIRIRIRIHRIHVFLGLPDPDPPVGGMVPDPDPALDPDPNPSIIMLK